MATQNFDQINILKRRSIPYEEYFADMQISDKQKKQRRELAYLLEDILIIYFMLLRDAPSISSVKVVANQNLMYDLYEVVDKGKYFGDIEDEETEARIDDYVTNLVDEISKATEKNLEEFPNDYDYTGTENYWVSDDRAKFIAEDQANTLCNSFDYNEAKAKGKTHKIWMAYGDDHVRPTHEQANGSKVPIDDYFSVGAAQMLYPKDVTSIFSTGAAHPEEVISCRCAVKYV